MSLVVLFIADTGAAYVTLLEGKGVRCRCIPVLDFEFVNSHQLLEDLRNPQDFYGIVFTSPRAVEAVRLAGDAEWGRLQPLWASNRTFVVGQATKVAASKLGLDGAGEESGTSNALAQMIINASTPSQKPILFPCSNLKTESLPCRLAQNGIALKDVTAYVTKPHPDLHTELERLKSEGNLVAVFYSPSGVEYGLPVLQKCRPSGVKFVALGPTTEAALRKAGVDVAAVATKPSPEALFNAIQPLL